MLIANNFPNRKAKPVIHRKRPIIQLKRTIKVDNYLLMSPSAVKSPIQILKAKTSIAEDFTYAVKLIFTPTVAVGILIAATVAITWTTLSLGDAFYQMVTKASSQGNTRNLPPL